MLLLLVHSTYPDELGDRGGAEVAAVAFGRHALATGEAERHVLAGASVQLRRVPTHLARRLQHQIGDHAAAATPLRTLRVRVRVQIRIAVVRIANPGAPAASGSHHHVRSHVGIEVHPHVRV